jgi:hypothetical protein
MTLSNYERLDMSEIPVGSVILADVDGNKTYKLVVGLDDDIMVGTKFCTVSRYDTLEDAEDEEELGDFIISKLRVKDPISGLMLPARTSEESVIKLGGALKTNAITRIEVYTD